MISLKNRELSVSWGESTTWVVQREGYRRVRRPLILKDEIDYPKVGPERTIKVCRASG